MKWPWLCALLGLLLARAALATIPLYENDAIVDYTGATGTYPPDIDATNFVNNGTFIITTFGDLRDEEHAQLHQHWFDEQ